MQSETYTLPALWTSFLVDGDGDSLSIDEITFIEEWLEKADLTTNCLSISGEPFFSWVNSATKFGCDCLQFVFQS